jgi:type IV secretion system protein VirB3
MSGGADSLPPGYRIELHAYVSAPVTMGGVPRGLAIAIGVFTLIVSMGLRMPYIGIPAGMAIWVVAYKITKDDPYFVQVLRRHLYHPPYFEG